MSFSCRVLVSLVWGEKTVKINGFFANFELVKVVVVVVVVVVAVKVVVVIMVVVVVVVVIGKCC